MSEEDVVRAGNDPVSATVSSDSSGVNDAGQGGLALLVPGGTGQLGRCLVAAAGDGVSRVYAPGSADLDLTSSGSVGEAVARFTEQARAQRLVPVVINAAADTAVDAAEDNEDRAHAVNADGPRRLAATCSAQQIPLVQVSTDYVFSGDAAEPYEPDDPVWPRTVYGRTKAAGEEAVLASGASAWVVRTAWVYSSDGQNFFTTMTRLERERDTVSVVDDQVGSPTSAVDLAGGLLELATRIASDVGPEHRILHCTGDGASTWFGFARAIFEELGADPERVRPCTTAEFPRPAPRPAYSVLSNAAWRAAGLAPLRSWRAGLGSLLGQGTAIGTSRG